MPHKETVWEAEPRTLAKVSIVEEYLKSWLPILSRYQGRVIYFDGFCGPGKYKNGEKGSPLAALETALNHNKLLKDKEIIFLFIDTDEERVNHLVEAIQDYTLPENIKVECLCSNFKKTILEILNDLEAKEKNIAPTFLFIDPFGVREASFELIERFMKNPRCEVLVNFMLEYINRFAKTPEYEKHLNELFGTTEWNKCIDESDSQECYRRLYESQLKKTARFTWSFEMKNKLNKTKYVLFFGTNNILGLEKMKDAMWKIDPAGDYTFSDRYYEQMTIYNNHFDPTMLKDIYLELEKKEYDIKEMEDFTLTDTPFRKAHVRSALKLLENESLIEVKRPGYHGYPPGTKIKIL